MTAIWQKISDFLHQANLIPLVVIVSVYHYYQALSQHDPFFVAAPMALFVDLLHFRTVQRAVKTGETSWIGMAALTTAIAFGLQWLFYSAPGPDGTLIWWETLLFASLVPVGLAIMAWHHAVHEEDVVVDWQAKLAAVGKQLAAAQERIVELTTAVANGETALSQAQERAAQSDALAAELTQARQTAQTGVSQTTAAQNRIAELEKQLAAVKELRQAWQSLNPESQTLVRYNAGLLSAEDAADVLGIHATTVRRKAKRLNGAAAEAA
jgi:hypothetical protein